MELLYFGLTGAIVVAVVWMVIRVERMISLSSRFQNALQHGPNEIGSWSELKLERALELSGLQKHVDFCPQLTLEDGRPDNVVMLPGGGRVILDSKAVTKHYFEALQQKSGSARKECLKKHARCLRDHINTLVKRRYAEQSEGSSDLVVMYVPFDGLLTAGFEADSGLMEHAIQKGIILAGPATIMSVLHAIGSLWRLREVAENLPHVVQLGREATGALTDFSDEFVKIGTALKKAVENYNDALNVYQQQLIPRFRQLGNIGILSSSPTQPKMVRQQPAALSSDGEASEPTSVD